MSDVLIPAPPHPFLELGLSNTATGFFLLHNLTASFDGQIVSIYSLIIGSVFHKSALLTSCVFQFPS